MGMKCTCRSVNGGGVPSFMLLLHIAGHPLSASTFILSCRQFSAYRGKFSAKRGKIKYLFACFCLTLGKSETKNGKNKDIFYFRGLQGLPLWLSIWGGGGVHWAKVVQGAGASGVLSWCVPPFCPAFVPLLLLLSCIGPILCLISHFKGVFRGFWGADVYLYGLRVLR